MCWPAQLDVAGRGPAEVVDGGGPAQELLDGVRDQVRVRLQLGELVGVLEQRQHRVGDGVPGGLVAGDDEQQEVAVELRGGHRLAVLGDLVDELADQVRPLAALAVLGENAPVVEDLLRHGRAEGEVLVLLALGVGDEDLGVLRVGEADDLVAPVDELAGLLLWHIEQAGEHLDREVRADVGDEVELALGESRVDRGARDVAQQRLVVAHQVRAAELARDQLAQRPVAEAVHLEDRAALRPAGPRRPPRDSRSWWTCRSPGPCRPRRCRRAG